jgi:hypothetical protein
MFCKVCNTRLEGGAPACPNCGATNPAAGGGLGGDAMRSSPFAPEADSLEADLGEVLQEAGVEIEEPTREVTASQGETVPIVASFNMDPAGIRKQLTERPDVLEPGLRVFQNEKGTPVGIGYSTGVGAIDLLARDERGGLVVVMVAEKGQCANLVAEMLQRIGWVRKHLAKGKEQPRGIVLVDERPENLDYAAAAVSDTISFKTYRVSLCFDDLEF